jgi:UDP-N-acetylmuramoylalanine--D-glutamate ligase
MPALDLLTRDKPDFYLLELSSFQLQRTKNLPAKVAVLLNISADHLDWHASVDEYRDAKYRIFAEAETAVINRDDDSIEQQLPEKMPRVSFGLDEPETDQYGLREEDGRLFLARGDQILLAVDDVSMVGAHNLENALAALAAGELIGLDVSSMLQVLNQFPGLLHRMQSVAHTTKKSNKSRLYRVEVRNNFRWNRLTATLLKYIYQL